MPNVIASFPLRWLRERSMTDPRPDVSGQESTHDSFASSPGAADDTITTPAGRYELLDEIAHGGMGIIYRANDTVMRREVAVKVLQPRLAPTAAAARRFIAEARIASQLQHPGIPAIHDLGTLADGRPFLAMKLIKGRTLDALLKKRGSDAPNLIAVFEQVCQAVGYAHAHGVIHRDLKPANIMVGAYGEVQVMDWGLAKVLKSDQRERSESDPEATLTQIESQREDGEATQAGSVLGTPAYMAPEQAIGAIDQVDARSDVFGLGAVLCAILTGKPPYVGADTEAVRQQAARARLDDAQARLAASWAEPGLVALCQRCLSAEKADRPADAREVAQVVAALRAAAEARARQAELERAQAEAETREQRKRRRVQLALAAAVGLLLAGGGSFAWYLDQQATLRRIEAANRERVEQARQERNAEALAELLDRCEAALRNDDAAGADAALKQAERRLLEGGGETLRARAEPCRAELALLRALDAIDTWRYTPVENHFPNDKLLLARWQAALAVEGLAPGQAPAGETAARVARSRLRERLLAVLELCLLFEPAAEVRAVLRAADPDPYREAVREAVAVRNDKGQADLAGAPEALQQPPRFAAALGQNVAVPKERRRLVLEAALRSRPGNLSLLTSLGTSYALNQREGADERLRWYQAAVAAHPLSVMGNNLLGVALLDSGDVPGAISAFQETLRLDPNYATAHNNLAAALLARGDLDGAIGACQEARRLDPRYVRTLLILAHALRAKGDLDGAIKAVQEALRLNPKYADTHIDLGIILADKRDWDGAIKAFQEALRLDPKAALASYNLGTALGRKGDPDGSVRAYREAVRLDPKSARNHYGLGNALRAKGASDGAILAYREAVRLDPKFAFAHDNLGNALRAKGDVDGAIQAYREAVRFDPKLFVAHNSLGIALLEEKGDVDGAIKAFQESLRLNSKDAGTHYNLGNALRAKGDLDGAIQAYQTALRLNPKLATAHHNLGLVLRAKGELDGAIHAYREALRLDPKLAGVHHNLGIALRTKGDLQGSLGCLQEAVRLKPKFALAHNDLGTVLADLRDRDGAIKAYREALRLDPQYATAHYNLGISLRDKGDLDGAAACFQDALRLNPKLALARNNLRGIESLRQLLARLPEILAGRAEPKTPAEGCLFAELCAQPFQKRFAAAARLYEKALTADPKRADDLTAGQRYNAACYAARSARGDGIDAPTGPAERAALRAHALAWLRADLALHKKQAASSDPTERQKTAAMLAHWLGDPDLTEVRPGKEPLALPAAERAEWEALWADVQATRAAAQEPPLPREEKRP
jgi:tetratricopeptide (TPR) repeat protein/tRNA A-37 threonylcarbamoyl transferase component Bud32